MVRGGASAHTQWFVVPGPAGVEDDERFVVFGRQPAGRDDIGHPLNLKVTPLGLLRTHEREQLRCVLRRQIEFTRGGSLLGRLLIDRADLLKRQERRKDGDRRQRGPLAL